MEMVATSVDTTNFLVPCVTSHMSRIAVCEGHSLSRRVLPVRRPLCFESSFHAQEVFAPRFFHFLMALLFMVWLPSCFVFSIWGCFEFIFFQSDPVPGDLGFWAELTIEPGEVKKLPMASIVNITEKGCVISFSMLCSRKSICNWWDRVMTPVSMVYSVHGSVFVISASFLPCPCLCPLYCRVTVSLRFPLSSYFKSSFSRAWFDVLSKVFLWRYQFSHLDLQNSEDLYASYVLLLTKPLPVSVQTARLVHALTSQTGIVVLVVLCYRFYMQ